MRNANAICKLLQGQELTKICRAHLQQFDESSAECGAFHLGALVQAQTDLGQAGKGG
jgi:hypothetical protein